MSDPFNILLITTADNPVHKKNIGLIDRSGKYRIGSPSRPLIMHDNGHLDLHNSRDPTFGDRTRLAKWITKLEASELLCTARSGKRLETCNNEDLSDANAAYRHFLFGNGADRKVDYERFLKNDPSAFDLIKNLTSDFKAHIEIIGMDRIKFSVTSDAYTIGRGGIAPYPATANWQKTLGAHFLWVSANIVVSVDSLSAICYRADMTIHAEDRYNFNPGATDIATGIPDSENGVFEITGLAHQYTQYAKISRNFAWRKGEKENL